MTADAPTWALPDLARCFEGAIPAVLATASADGVPNVTYLSRARMVDDRHLALSNQFLSKTARNLAENPFATLLLMDVVTHDEFRLTLRFERTERRGRVFDQLRADVDALAALSGMEGVFRLRGADIYEVMDVELVPPHPDHVEVAPLPRAEGPPSLARLAALCGVLGRCTDLDMLVSAAVDGIARELGHEHVHILLLEESGERLYTIASRGYPAQQIGSEVRLGEGLVGTAAAQCRIVRVGNLKQATKYSATVRHALEVGGVGPGREIPAPDLPNGDSRLVVPAMALGQLVGVIVVDSTEPVAFTEDDEATISVVAALVATMVETLRAEERLGEAVSTGTTTAARGSVGGGPGTTVRIRHFVSDGSVFLDEEYLIKGVAGRLLWLLVTEHATRGRTEFTNREVRLDPSLELPQIRDNFESRLILLKRRLDERDAPLRIERTGRGRFRLDVDAAVRLDRVDG